MTNKWLKKAEIYRFFAEGFYYEAWFAHIRREKGLMYQPTREECPPCPYEFTVESAEELFQSETFGRGKIEVDCFSASNNGYSIGKKWCDVQVSAWLSDLEMFIDGEENPNFHGRFPLLKELYADEKYKHFHWWLDNIFHKHKDVIKIIKEER